MSFYVKRTRIDNGRGGLNWRQIIGIAAMSTNGRYS
jgi:hypothetical protein